MPQLSVKRNNPDKERLLRYISRGEFNFSCPLG